MRSRTWLVMGLACALSAPVAAQPAAPAPTAQPAAGTPAKKQAKKAPRKPKTAEVTIEIGPTVAALNGASVDAAIKAAEALGQSTDPAAHEALLDSLALGTAPTVAVAIMNALAAHPAPPDIHGLVRYSAHRSASVRSAALGSLSMYPAPAAKQALVNGLRDMNPGVRAAAAAAAAKGRVREAIDPLLELLARGEDPASKALAAMADAELARKLGDQLGKVPDETLAATLGLVLKRTDFGPDPARVELVRAIGKIQDPSAVRALTDYLDATPKNPPRESRTEAQKMVEARLGGGK